MEEITEVIENEKGVIALVFAAHITTLASLNLLESAGKTARGRLWGRAANLKELLEKG